MLTCVGESENVSEEWNRFKNCVKVEADVGRNEEASTLNDGAHMNIKRETLHKYYDYLLGDNAWDRIIAAKNWMLWEMTVSKFSGNTEVEVDANKDVNLLIGAANDTWLLKQVGKDGEERAMEKIFDATVFRQWSQHNHGHCYERARQSSFSNDVWLEPRLTRNLPQLPKTKSKQLQNMTDEDIQNFIPAQAMLTCFYSVNNEFIMSKFDLLSRDNIDRIKHIPCIAVQGGQDSICPPDSALDLKELWPCMELRIVVSGRHSQYDPQIMSELLKATDQIATLNSKK